MFPKKLKILCIFPNVNILYMNKNIYKLISVEFGHINVQFQENVIPKKNYRDMK